MTFPDSTQLLFFLKVLFIAGSWLAAIDALYSTRAPQAIIAWAISLILFPYAVLPVYLLIGRRRFRGYRRMSRRMRKMRGDLVAQHRVDVSEYSQETPEHYIQICKTLQEIAGAPFLSGNRVELLAEGRHFFDALHEEIRGAKQQVLLCFYIVRDDKLGHELKTDLIDARKRGVEVRFLFDEIGSFLLGKAYVEELRAAGIDIRDFNTRQGRWNYFQVNFRNHRKIAVIDGRVGFVGGFNIGDEYLERSKAFGQWRDTQVRISGPAVKEIEAVFISDWTWATQKPATASSSSPERTGAMPVLTVATGPTDDKDRCPLLFQELFLGARKRIWIASPYFIPDDALLQSLKLAALRGVEVHIYIPEKADSMLSNLACQYFLPQLIDYGVKIFRYTKGFLHEKVVLVDDWLSTVGSVNIDNRSLRLAFEITLVVADREFAKNVEAMFVHDRTSCHQLAPFKLEQLPLHLRLAVSVARLFSPLL